MDRDWHILRNTILWFCYRYPTENFKLNQNSTDKLSLLSSIHHDWDSCRFNSLTHAKTILSVLNEFKIFSVYRNKSLCYYAYIKIRMLFVFNQLDIPILICFYYMQLFIIQHNIEVAYLLFKPITSTRIQKHEETLSY